MTAAAKLYQPMPVSDRKDWPILLHNRQPGPLDPAAPFFQAQGRAEACTAFATAKGVEFLAYKLHLRQAAIDAFDLFHQLDPSVGYAPGDVFPVAMDRGVGGWRIAPPLYEGRFDGAFACAIKRWPLIVTAQRPKPPGPDGWTDGWLPPVPGQISGHAMLAYKPAWRHLGKDPEYGLWCLDSSSGLHPWVAVPESMLAKAAFNAFRTLKRAT